MMHNEKLFPEGVALGRSFLNRENERKILINRIKSIKHTVLIAPRRYGKTSLVLKVASEMGIPYCSIDLLAAYNEEYVRDQIVNKLSKLVFDLLPRMSKAKKTLINIFKRMKPEISIGAFGQKLSLNLSNQPLHDISEVLLRLDETAKSFKKQAVVFIDEFQQISQLKNHHSIEASIRHAVERSENIAYVFSGSNRHLLQQMFGDQGRPLYRLCQTLTLDRMKPEAYVPYLQAAAHSKWKKKVSTEFLNRIFMLTELHPFYMNILCQLLWEKKSMPSLEDIDIYWDNYVKTQKYIITQDITDISINQRRIIAALAKAPTSSFQSIEFVAPLKISPSSAQQSADALLQKDLIYQDNNGLYKILDPAVRYYLDTVLWEQ